MYSLAEKYIITMISSLSLVGLTLAIILLYQFYTLPESHDTTVSSPAFQRGECFNATTDREVWEVYTTPDGIIEKVGKKSYLVLFRAEAERRGRDKIAFTVSIPTFDSTHVKTVCPETWSKHTHK